MKLVVSLLSVLILSVVSSAAEDGLPSFPYTQFPELKAYIEQDVPEPSPDDATVTKVDLNRPADGVAEYIIGFQSTLFCGSGGCATDVVRISKDGKVERLAGILSYGFSLAYTSTNGMLDLLTQGKSGAYIWRFDGKEYKPHKGHPKAATTKPKNWTPPRVFAADEQAKARPKTDVASKPGRQEKDSNPTGIENWIPWQEESALRPYLQKKNSQSPLGQSRVAMVDLNRPDTGKVNYIVEYDGPGYCKSEGCLREVIGFHFNEPAAPIAEMFGYGFRLGNTATNGKVDLITETAFGDAVWAFNGVRYEKVLDPRPIDLGGTGGKRISIARKQRSPKPYVGPAPRAPGCVGEYGWRRSYEVVRGVRRGYASFGHCTDPENMVVSLTCRSDQQGVEASLEINPETSGTVQVQVQVDRASYSVNAVTRHSEMAGYGLPTFRLAPRDRLLNALARGQLARFIVGKKAAKVHLKGAARAINAMRRACPR